MTNRSDDALMRDVAAAFAAADAPPAAAIDAAKSVFTWRTIDEELAQLVFDSAVDELAGVRSADTARQMTFTSPAINIEITVMNEGSRRLVGQVDPPTVGTVELRHGDSVWSAETDEIGRFMFDGIPAGPLSLRCSMPDGTSITTEWTLF
ncbi:MAG: hypothetical protein HKN07_01230 [Acidimicrobiia bacterium]|nr:hypothetical protein [Acidimicrobiia bacterium]